MLRALEPEDLEFIYELENDQEEWKTSMHTAPLSLYQLRNYIATNNADIYQDTQVRLMACYDGENVGLADITTFDPVNHKAEIGIAIHPTKRGKGYASRMLDELIDYSKNIHLNQIYAIISEDNDACLSLFRSKGINHTATLQQWLFDGKTYKNALLFQIFL